MNELIVSHFNYWAVVVLMMVGLYVVFASGNMVKRLVGLGVFQTSVFLLYISMGKVAGGRPPILPEQPVEEHDAEVGHAAGAAPGAHDALNADSDAAGNAVDVHEEDVSATGDASEQPAVDGEAGLAAPVEPSHAGAETAAPHPDFTVDALDAVYSNPLPHVLILTAIVVGVATLAVGLALVVRIREVYGTIEEDDINRAEYDAEVEGADA